MCQKGMLHIADDLDTSAFEVVEKPRERKPRTADVLSDDESRCDIIGLKHRGERELLFYV